MSAARRFDPYEVLGVDKEASDAEVKSAFRKRAKETHPDKGGNAEEFEQVSRANIVLADPAKRKRFDETGEADEVKPDLIEAQALNLLNGIMQAILTDERDPFCDDIIKAIQQVLHTQIGEMRARLTPLYRAKKRAEKMATRFKPKKAGENRIQKMLQWHLTHINKEIGSVEAQIEQRKRAIEIVSDYEFERDAPSRDPLFNAFAFPPSGLSSASFFR